MLNLFSLGEYDKDKNYNNRDYKHGYKKDYHKGGYNKYNNYEKDYDRDYKDNYYNKGGNYKKGHYNKYEEEEHKDPPKRENKAPKKPNPVKTNNRFGIFDA